MSSKRAERSQFAGKRRALFASDVAGKRKALFASEVHPGLEPRATGEGFHARVYALVRMVPFGRVTTYGDVATMLGTPRIARHVGWALSALPPDSDVPWQRVINAHAMVSWRGELGRASLQEALLRAEGVALGARGKVDLQALRWHYPGVTVPFGS